MGLLTADQERQCYFYLGYIGVNRTGVFVGGQPETTEVVQKLQVSLDNLIPAKLQTVTDLLTVIAAKYANLSAVDASFQALAAGKVTLQPREWEMRMRQYNFYRRQLAVVLDVALDPNSEADSAGGGGANGPWREP